MQVFPNSSRQPQAGKNGPQGGFSKSKSPMKQVGLSGGIKVSGLNKKNT